MLLIFSFAADRFISGSEDLHYIHSLYIGFLIASLPSAVPNLRHGKLKVI